MARAIPLYETISDRQVFGELFWGRSSSKVKTSVKSIESRTAFTNTSHLIILIGLELVESPLALGEIILRESHMLFSPMV